MVKKIWNPGGIAWMSVFFSIIPAGILYAYNAERLNLIKSKYYIIIPVIIIVILLIIFLPQTDYYDDIFKTINILAAFTFYFTQRDKFKTALASGWQRASFKLPILYSLIFVTIIVAAYFLPGSSILLDKENTFENEKVSVEIPKGWDAVQNYEEDVILETIKENDIASINIDNVQLYSVPNSEVIKNFSPQDILAKFFLSIEETTKQNPEAGWSNFRIIQPAKTIEFKNLKASEGIFTVDENILDKGNIVNRKIHRILIFTDNDIFNIIFASTDTASYVEEKNDFKTFLDSLVIKQ